MCSKQKYINITHYYNYIMSTKYIDHLNEDKPIPGQMWACVSFLSPEGIKNCSVRGLKIRGVFGTRKEADEHAVELQKYDPDFHVFVGEVGKWLPYNPEVDEIEDQVYQEKELNDLMREYKNNMAKAKQMEEQRKADMLEKAAKEEQVKSLRPVDRKRAELQKKLADRNATNVESLSNKDFKKEESKINAEKESMSSVKTEIQKGEQQLNDYDEKLNRIQELYSKLQQEKK
jgi:DNA repair exonuclease SbcCD ATPase subunit